MCFIIRRIGCRKVSYSRSYLQGHSRSLIMALFDKATWVPDSVPLCVCLCYLPLYHKVQKKISSSTGSPGSPGKRAVKRHARACAYPNCSETLSVITSPPAGVRSIAMSVSVCMSVCLLVYFKNHMSKLHQIFSSVRVTRGRGSVLRWR